MFFPDFNGCHNHQWLPLIEIYIFYMYTIIYSISFFPKPLLLPFSLSTHRLYNEQLSLILFFFEGIEFNFYFPFFHKKIKSSHSGVFFRQFFRLFSCDYPIFIDERERGISNSWKQLGIGCVYCLKEVYCLEPKIEVNDS